MLLGRRRRFIQDAPEFKAITQAVNHMTQSGPLPDKEAQMKLRFVERVVAHNGPWFDDLRGRPVRICRSNHPGLIVDNHGNVQLEDLVTGERWLRDYQCIRQINEMEAIAYAASEAPARPTTGW